MNIQEFIVSKFPEIKNDKDWELKLQELSYALLSGKIEFELFDTKFKLNPSRVDSKSKLPMSYDLVLVDKSIAPSPSEHPDQMYFECLNPDKAESEPIQKGKDNEQSSS